MLFNYKNIKNLFVFFIIFGLVGCQVAPPKDLLKPPAEVLKIRQVQSRSFKTLEEDKILSASAGLLQDMGYTLSESETKLGILVADKDRETDNKGQKAFATTMLVLGALSGSANSHPYRGVEHTQKIRVSLVTKPDSYNKQTNVRVNFQRMVWDMEGNLMRLQTLDDLKMYQGFFSKLSKSIFLEAHAV